MTDHRPTGAGKQSGWTWLDVPYGEKDEAKALGTRWDPTAKRWYNPQPPAPGQVRPSLARWAARPDVPDLLPGEDRTNGSGLFVDMVPSSCWFTNVRSCVSPQDWERLRRMITRRAGHVCEICGAAEDRSTSRWMEAHERWTYDDHTGVQALRRLICLCSPCHLSTHMGYANITGRADQALAHLRTVTGMTKPQAWRHVDQAGALWTTRSRRTWTLDLSMLTDAGVTLARPNGPPNAAPQQPAPSHDRPNTTTGRYPDHAPHRRPVHHRRWRPGGSQPRRPARSPTGRAEPGCGGSSTGHDPGLGFSLAVQACSTRRGKARASRRSRGCGYRRLAGLHHPGLD